MIGIKYLSIITNFGCHWKCHYCITKTQGINIPKTTISLLDNLEIELQKNKYDIISVSGGGDPLHEYDSHVDFYDRLFEIADKFNLPIEMHTSYLDSNFPYEKCYRIVYHINWNNYFKVKRYGNEMVRVVLVESEYARKWMYLDLAYKISLIKEVDEFSIRQLICEDFKPYTNNIDFFKAGHKLKVWYYIEHCDYNTYFTENGIENEFMSYKEDRSDNF